MNVEKRLKEIEENQERLLNQVQRLAEKVRLLGDRNRSYQELVNRLVNEMPYDTTSLSVEEILQTKRPLINYSQSFYLKVLQCAFSGDLRRLPYRRDVPDFDLACIWGMNPNYNGTRLLISAKQRSISVVRMEDGFLEAVCPPNYQHVEEKYLLAHSFVLDRVGLFTNGVRPSDLENMLNSSRELTADESARAQDAIDFIIQNKISKYNHQPIISNPSGLGTRSQKVLVVDQVWGDSSIVYGLATDASFHDMLEAAKRENPQADIIIKTHPVSNGMGRRRHFTAADAEDERVHFIDYDVNPISLLEQIDKVYVCTSQLGFEALMLGKEVHTFGMPFYAGWGVTHDHLTCPRRKKKRSVLEIFYFAYIAYSVYVSYKTQAACEIEDVLKELLKLRAEYKEKL